MFFVYILLCRGGTYYTGYTNDIDKRLMTHNQGKASKYTRSRLPVKVVYIEECSTKSEAMKREIAIKKLKHLEKKLLAETYLKDN
ncbi:MAG TPA: GIY-YIG nuclease family protein [Syntrophomonadaceae bacterium]|nr:GIY-YIG nuclease family protein [Syntrophomonadaceae bacterium]